MEDWKEYKLKDFLLIPIRNGLTKPSAIRGQGVKMIGMKEIFAMDRIRSVEMERVPVTDKEYESSNIRENDLLFARQSLSLEGAGKCSIVLSVDEPTVFESHIIRLRIDKEKADPFFLYYYFKSSKGRNQVKSLVQQVAAAGIKGKELIELPIIAPSLDYQKKVTVLLKNIDDKIECNRQINENLEQQAQALFKSWFVDFEPFKDQPFVESELGMIPQGWKVGIVKDLCVTNKRSYKGDFAKEIEYIDTGSVTNNVIDSVQILNPATDKIPSRARRAVMEGDIIYSSVRPNQRHYALLFNPSANTVVSTGFVVITANWSGYRYFIYQFLIQDEFVDKLQAIAEQSVSTFPSLNASDITNLKIVIPPNDVVGDYASMCCSLFAKIYENQQESRRLVELRDTLLPKLMSGEINVNNL